MTASGNDDNPTNGDKASESPEDLGVLEFPCEFPIKVFGHDEDNFENWVFELVCRHVQDPSEVAATSRPSSGGKYLAVTVVVTVYDRAQLDGIYIELTGHERTLMVL